MLASLSIKHSPCTGLMMVGRLGGSGAPPPSVPTSASDISFAEASTVEICHRTHVQV